MSTSFINKYRPTCWDEVIGQDQTVAGLQSNLTTESRMHSFILVGRPGVGKTTISRLIASELNCKGLDLVKMNVLENGLIEDVRSLVRTMGTRPMFGDSKVAIIDECHALTDKGWSAFLIATEEALDTSFYVFCTTEDNKIPQANIERSHYYHLGSINPRLLKIYLTEYILEAEQIKLIDGLLDVIVEQSQGSVRQALSLLSQYQGYSSLEEAKDQISKTEIGTHDTEIKDLAKLLITRSTNWSSFNSIITSLSHQGGLGNVKHKLLAYISSIITRTYDLDRLKALMFALDSADMLKSEGSQPELLASLQLMAGRQIIK
jgi:DNA polymerase III subunit gamma/tau